MRGGVGVTGCMNYLRVIWPNETNRPDSAGQSPREPNHRGEATRWQSGIGVDGDGEGDERFSVLLRLMFMGLCDCCDLAAVWNFYTIYHQFSCWMKSDTTGLVGFTEFL